MNYHNIVHDDMLNGDGLRVTLFVSGCNHKCKDCQNPETWDKESGIPFDIDAYNEICAELDKDYISGLTLSGGDPLLPENRPIVEIICRNVKSLYPNKTIWLYTGYKFNNIKKLDIMQYVDVVVDDVFKKDLLSPTLPWVGSSNQNVIDVQKSLVNGKVILKS